MMTSQMNGQTASLPLDHVCRGAAELLRAVGHPLRRLTVRVGDTSVEIEWPAPVVGQVVGQVAAAPTPPANGVDPVDPVDPAPAAHLVTAPHVGTFYRCPEPGSAPFVTEGDLITRGQQVGILEAMKLMNPVEADHGGRVLEVLVADGTPVEFEQPLIALAAGDGHGGGDNGGGDNGGGGRG
ncbi:MAG TPA: biotin/lipoyl-containing protein [Mycobacteriales bacterium]